MAGWSKRKRQTVERNFYLYLDKCVINSKDAGQVSLGKSLYEGQRRVITQIFDALEQDIHRVYILKSRQLGISTLIRALTIFLLGVSHGLKGAIVFDSESNKNQARAEIETMIDDLPKTLKFPDIKRRNRSELTLGNDATVLFMSAGTKKTKASGTLGRSVGLSVAHCSELCSWDNDDGFEAFENSLSDINPDRLYIYESTARGFNKWYDLYEEAKADPAHCKTIFIGFWAKDTQRIDETDADFLLYGQELPTEKEQEMIKAVREQYGVEIAMPVLAWYRRRMHPATQESDSHTDDEEANPLRIQEQPATEQECWQNTGAVFFAAQTLTDLTNNYVQRPKARYMFQAGEEFFDMKIYRADTLKATELKVWEEPQPDSEYVLGVDPAYGENENNCRSAIEIFRCYADGLDQVAEYAWPLITTRHLAWALAALLGWYGGHPRSSARYILELNGPGTATFNALKDLRYTVENATYLKTKFEEKGLENIFQNVKTYVFNRPDAMGPGFNYHWLTNTRLKITIFEQFRDIVSNGRCRLRSLDLIKEMNSIARDGDEIGAQGSKKDDRTIASALANYYWATRIRQKLIQEKRTRASEEARARLSIVDQVALFNQNSLEQFFAQKQMIRANDLRQAQRNAWRNGQGTRYGGGRRY